MCARLCVEVGYRLLDAVVDSERPRRRPGLFCHGWYLCSNGSRGKLAQNNLPSHLECFRALICLWRLTSVHECKHGQAGWLCLWCLKARSPHPPPPPATLSHFHLFYIWHRSCCTRFYFHTSTRTRVTLVRIVWHNSSQRETAEAEKQRERGCRLTRRPSLQSVSFHWTWTLTCSSLNNQNSAVEQMGVKFVLQKLDFQRSNLTKI